MKRRDLLLVIISRCQTKQEFGRTALQKVSYFVGLALGQDLGHGAHYYGPYSPAVEQDVEALVLSGLIDESVSQLGFFNEKGFPGRRYAYEVTDEGTSRIGDLKLAHLDEYDKITQVIDELASFLGGLDQATLSAAAKVVYLTRREGGDLKQEEIATLATELGWKLPGPTVDRVASVLDLDPAFRS